MKKEKSLKNIIEDVLENHRIDLVLQELINILNWDDLLLALSNICIFRSNREEKFNKKEYKKWLDRALNFYNAIEDLKKSSVLSKKIRKDLEKVENE